MPFLQKTLHKYSVFFKTVNKIVTLQVRNSPNLLYLSVKRVFPSASLYKCGSLTIEAALSMSLFIFAAITLIMPMRLMDSQRKIQAVLESVCEDASQYAYIQLQLGKENQGLGIAAYTLMKINNRIKAFDIDNISFSESKILEDGETIDLVIKYGLRLPFPVFRIASLPMKARSCRRAWIGRDGGRKGEGGIDEEMVYVGRTATRYHRSRTCHYIYNNISSVALDNVGEYRNAEGRKYKSCSRCIGAVSSGSLVYIMPNGNSYHSSMNCSAISAYVRSVPLSTVEYLGPCSYCSK